MERNKISFTDTQLLNLFAIVTIYIKQSSFWESRGMKFENGVGSDMCGTLWDLIEEDLNARGIPISAEITNGGMNEK